jgi:hypothetical protein
MDDPQQTGLGILTGKLTELARRFVAEHGRFQPFAGAIGRDGEITHLGVDPSVEEPDRAIELLAQDIRALDSDAGVVAADVRATPPRAGEPTDCIMVIAEERSGSVTRTFIPYTRGADGSVVYGEKFSDTSPARVLFADQA